MSDAKNKRMTISYGEYLRILEQARFRCPIKRNPKDCDGSDCPEKSNGEDYYDDCVNMLDAKLMLKRILLGEVQVRGFAVRA